MACKLSEPIHPWAAHCNPKREGIEPAFALAGTAVGAEVAPGGGPAMPRSRSGPETKVCPMDGSGMEQSPDRVFCYKEPAEKGDPNTLSVCTPRAISQRISRCRLVSTPFASLRILAARQCSATRQRDAL